MPAEIRFQAQKNQAGESTRRASPCSSKRANRLKALICARIFQLPDDRIDEERNGKLIAVIQSGTKIVSKSRRCMATPLDCLHFRLRPT